VPLLQLLYLASNTYFRHTFAEMSCDRKPTHTHEHCSVFVAATTDVCLFIGVGEGGGGGVMGRRIENRDGADQ